MDLKFTVTSITLWIRYYYAVNVFKQLNTIQLNLYNVQKLKKNSKTECLKFKQWLYFTFF